MKNKETRQIKLVNFECDDCRENSGFRSEIDSECYKGQLPFPYDRGWVYIYNFAFKIFGNSIVIKDKHFCSRICLIKFVNKLMNRACAEEMKKCQN